MRIAEINNNDCVNGEGVSVSLFVQGCPIHCEGCFNSNTWDFCGGTEVKVEEVVEKVAKAIPANGIQRNFSVLGGEPLCDENAASVAQVIHQIKEKFPNIKIYLWSGYTLDILKAKDLPSINTILKDIDTLIVGPFILSERDISLPLCGSRNQKVLRKGIDF